MRAAQPGERLVVSGRAAGGSGSQVGATADVSKGPVVHLTHLSHPFSWLTTLPRGSGGQLFLPSSVVPRWPTCGSAAVSVAFACGGPFSREIITLLAPSPLNRHSFCVSASIGADTGRDCNPRLQMKHQLNENRKAALSINVQPFFPNRVIDSMHTQVFHLFLAISPCKVIISIY